MIRDLLAMVLRRVANRLDPIPFHDILYPDVKYSAAPIDDEVDELPTIDEVRCFRCRGNMSFPHFSIEEFPQAFCMYFCAREYGKQHVCGVYTWENGKTTIIEEVN